MMLEKVLRYEIRSPSARLCLPTFVASDRLTSLIRLILILIQNVQARITYFIELL